MGPRLAWVDSEAIAADGAYIRKYLWNRFAKSRVWQTWHALGVFNMFRTFFNTCGVSIATLALGLSLVATPVMAMGGGGFHGGGGGFHGGGGGFHGGGFHGGGGWGGGGYGGGGYGGWGGGYGDGYGYGYGYGGAALGLGLLGGAILGSQYPYYGSGYASYPQDGYVQGGGVVSSASCASRFKSYNPATGTYLGYDGLRHPCP
jgi:BA14K-like protein